MTSKFSRRTIIIEGTAAAGLGALGFSLAAPKVRATSAAQPVRLGMIGLGWRGGTLLDALGQLPEAEIVALRDPEAKFLASMAASSKTARSSAAIRCRTRFARICTVSRRWAQFSRW
jgi:hypothetical protein